MSRGDWGALAAGAFGSFGDLLVSLSTITWALFSVYSRKALQRHAAAPMMLYVMAGGWVMSAVPWVLAGGLGRVAQLAPSGWTAIVFLGVLCSGLAYVFWYDALRVLPTAKVGSLLYLEPLVTMGVAAALLGEPVRFSSIVGGLVILLGIRTATVVQASGVPSHFSLANRPDSGYNSVIHPVPRDLLVKPDPPLRRPKSREGPRVGPVNQESRRTDGQRTLRSVPDLRGPRGDRPADPVGLEVSRGHAPHGPGRHHPDALPRLQADGKER